MEPQSAIWILLVGATVLVAALIDSVAHCIRLPSIVGYLAIGWLLGAADARWDWLGDPGRTAFGLLADLGIVALLFQVGLRSHLSRLLEKLRPAALIWTGNVALSGASGWLVARWAGLDVAASLTIATAMTATSIGISAAAWDQRRMLDTDNGALMLDVAELDDLSAVLLMALLFTLLGSAGGGQALAPSLIETGAAFIAKFVGFTALCYVFARYAESPLTRFAGSLERVPQRMLIVAGAGFMIAAVAGLLGFSLAVGALFAGLVFSRDPEAVRSEARFDDVRDFLVPFFFVGIGLEVELGSLDGAWLLAGALTLAASAGKLAGTALPALLVTTPAGALLIGTSMVPRAEIALVVAYEGLTLGALSENLYTTVVLVSVVTCAATPWLIDVLLVRAQAGSDAAASR